MQEIRKEAGLTGRALAAATGQRYTRVSKIENGVQPPTTHDIERWCRACGAEAQIPDLVASLRAVESANREFRRQGRAGLQRVLAAMLSFWIDFLQIPSDLDAAVAVRMERQRVIYQRGRRFAVVIEEQALRTWFGDADVHAGQLDRCSP